MDFASGLSLLRDSESNSYDTILIIVDWLAKMVHYKVVKNTINILELAEVIINTVIKYHDLLVEIDNQCP